MDQPNFGTYIKNRSQKSQNFYISATSFQHSNSSITKNISYDKNHQIAYIYAYLTVQKNMKQFTHSIKKLLLKQKRYSFHKIQEYLSLIKNEKNKQIRSFSTKMQATKMNSKTNKFTTNNLITNPQISKNLQQICLKKSSQILNKCFWTIKFHKLCIMNDAFSKLKLFQKYSPQKIRITSNQPQPKANQSKQNKRKTRKDKDYNNQQIKQNSQYNFSQISIQNQRLQNQLKHDEIQQEQFIEKMSQLLDYHQKFLLQGSTTTRNKKNNHNNHNHK